MIDSLVWLKENVEDNQELRDFVDYKDWQRKKEENDDRIKTAGFETKELQRH
jgi:hypothetical protein